MTTLQFRARANCSLRYFVISSDYKQLFQDAAIAYSQYDYAQAAQLFTSLMEVKPNDADLRYRRGLAAARAGQLELAMKDFVAALPDIVRSSKPMRDFGAQIVLDTCAQMDDEYPRLALLFCRGLGHFALHNEIPFDDDELNKAIRDFEALTKENPGEARVWYFRGLMHAETFDLKKAVEALWISVDIDSKNRRALMALASFLMQTKEWKDAVGVYTMALDIDPSYIPALEYRAKAYLRLERFKEAKQDVDKALELGGDSCDLHYLCGAANWRLKNRHEAIREFKAALDMAEDNSVPLVNYFSIWLRDEAIEAFTWLIKEEPRKPDGYVGRGRAKGYQAAPSDSYDLQCQADSDFEKSIKLDPQNSMIHFYRGTSVSFKLWDTARKHFEQAVHLDPNNVRAIHKMLSCSNDTNAKEWKALLRDFPDSKVIQEALLRVRGDDSDFEFENLNKVIESAETGSAFYGVRGDFYFNRKIYDMAMQDYLLQLAYQPEDVNALLARARLHFTQGHNELAEKDLAEVERISSSRKSRDDRADQLRAQFASAD